MVPLRRYAVCCWTSATCGPGPAICVGSPIPRSRVRPQGALTLFPPLFNFLLFIEQRGDLKSRRPRKRIGFAQDIVDPIDLPLDCADAGQAGQLLGEPFRFTAQANELRRDGDLFALQFLLDPPVRVVGFVEARQRFPGAGQIVELAAFLGVANELFDPVFMGYPGRLRHAPTISVRGRRFNCAWMGFARFSAIALRAAEAEAERAGAAAAGAIFHGHEYEPAAA